MFKTCTVLLALVAFNCPAQVFDRGLTAPRTDPLSNGASIGRNPTWTDARVPRQPVEGQPLKFNLPAPGPIIRTVSLMPAKPRLVVMKSAGHGEKVAAFTKRRHKLLNDIREARTKSNSLEVGKRLASLSLLHLERILWLRKVADRVSPKTASPFGPGEFIPKAKVAPKLVVPKLPSIGR